MTGPDDTDGGRPALSVDRAAAWRRLPKRPPVQVQIERLSADLGNMSVLATAGDAVAARGAALVVAHAALRLAVMPVVGADDRRYRADMLRSTVAPALGRTGLDHVVPLIEAALAHDGDPALAARSVERPQ